MSIKKIENLVVDNINASNQIKADLSGIIATSNQNLNNYFSNKEKLKYKIDSSRAFYEEFDKVFVSSNRFLEIIKKVNVTISRLLTTREDIIKYGHSINPNPELSIKDSSFSKSLLEIEKIISEKIDSIDLWGVNGYNTQIGELNKKIQEFCDDCKDGSLVMSRHQIIEILRKKSIRIVPDLSIEDLIK